MAAISMFGGKDSFSVIVKGSVIVTVATVGRTRSSVTANVPLETLAV